MTDLSRRTMLSGGLKAALGAAGGLLLPWQGGGAFALPDIGRAAGVPVSTGPLPVSAETVELRRIMARQHEAHMMGCSTDEAYELRKRLWRKCAEEYAATSRAVLERPIQSWGQAVEIAEICWRYHPKAWAGPPGYNGVPRDGLVADWAVLSLDGAGMRRGGNHLSPVPYLIEAVLKLGGGQRREPTFAPDVQTLDYVASASEILRFDGVPWLA